MPRLNTTFKLKSNAAFNNTLFKSLRIRRMHEQMDRLYKAAKDLLGVEGQSEVARLLNKSPQNINNWESRGISSAGILEAGEILGCSPTWLKTGNGPMVEPSQASQAMETVGPGVSDRLKEALSRKVGATQAEMARSCGIKPPSVNDWFSGKTKSVSSEHLFKLADYLGVSARWLATGKGALDSGEFRAPPSGGPEQEISGSAQALIRKITECDQAGALSPALAKAIEATIKAVSVAAASEATREKTGGNAEAPAGADKPEATEKAELPDMSKFDDFSHNSKKRQGGTGTNGRD